MIAQVREWYSVRSRREQGLLLLMAAILVPLLLWLLLVMPLTQAYDDALQRHLQAVDRNGRVKALAARASSRQARAPAPVPDMPLFLTDSARQRGISTEATAGSAPGSATITVASSSAPAALDWLRNLEMEGYQVSDVRIAPTGGGSVAVTATVSGSVP